MGLKSPWEFFFVGGGGMVRWGGSVANIIEHGLLHTCILEIEN